MRFCAVVISTVSQQEASLSNDVGNKVHADDAWLLGHCKDPAGKRIAHAAIRDESGTRQADTHT
jgi:hypothetical protein